MDIFEKNYEAYLKEYGKKLARVENDGTFFLTEARNGEPIINVNMGNGNCLRMSSEYDPSYEASVWAKQYKEEERASRIAIYGIGNVYYLEALLDAAWAESMFVVKEPDQKFFSFLMNNIDMTRIINSKQIIIVDPDDSDDFLMKNIAALIPFYGDQRIEGITMPFYNANEEFLEMCRKGKLLRDTNLGFNYSLGQRALFDNYYALWNIGENYSFSEFRKNLPEDIPVIVVAAGPSLLKNGALLKKFKNRAIIIAVARATAPLHKLGVEPDMVSTIDPAQPLKHIEEENIGNARILMDTAGNYDIQKKYKGKIIYANETDFISEAPGYKGKGFCIQGDLGGSVATWSVQLMKSAGFKTIIVVGQDLAAGKDSTHADGANEVDFMTYTEVDGIDGGKVLARTDWNRFRMCYEDQVIKGSDIRFIDATEGGALIKGSEVMTLQEVLDTVCTKEYDLSGIIKKLPKSQTEEEQKLSREFVEDDLKEADEVKDVMLRVEKLASQIRKMMKYHTDKKGELSKKVEKMNPLMDELASHKVYVRISKSCLREAEALPTFGGNFSDDARGEHEFSKLENYAKLMVEGVDVFKKGVKEFINEEL